MSASRLEPIVSDFASCRALDAIGAAPCFEVERGEFHALMEALRERGAFETVTYVTAVDRSPDEPRFEMQYMLLSLQHTDRVRVQLRLSESDAKIATITDLWPGANYFERECFDLFGIEFEGHPALERLLMPDGYGHHPLRKDFPHQGIEPDRLYRAWERARAQQEREANTPRA